MNPLIVVAAAVIERGGRLLITRRPAGVHLAGVWEFPGGKCEPGESVAQCTVRELREELAIDAEVGDELLCTTHHYEDRDVELHFVRASCQGEPAPQLGQEMRWVYPTELAQFEFPPADQDLIRQLAG